MTSAAFACSALACPPRGNPGAERASLPISVVTSGTASPAAREATSCYSGVSPASSLSTRQQSCCVTPPASPSPGCPPPSHRPARTSRDNSRKISIRNRATAALLTGKVRSFETGIDTLTGLPARLKIDKQCCNREIAGLVGPLTSQWFGTTNERF